MNRLDSRNVLSALLSLFLAMGIWYFLAPTQLGGWVTYVIVDGNSMEPGFHLGDLALMRKQSAYQLGDAVTYQNAEMGRYVFHRIVNIEQDRFVLKGDNNTWLDSYHPTRDEMIGKLWVHLPKLGNLIQWARQPLILALGCALLGGVMMSGLFFSQAQRGKTKETFGMEDILKGALHLVGVGAVILFGFGVFAFTRPLSIASDSLQYQQDGRFFYSAAAAPGVYDGNVIQTGDPIFPKLGCAMNVGMAYNLTGVGLQNVVGTRMFFARVLEEQSGWQRLIPLEAETAFSGNTYFNSAQLDLCQIQSLVASMEQQTGMRPSTYTLEVIAHSTFAATLDGQPVFDSYDAILPFKFDKVHFYLAADVKTGESLQVTKQGSGNGQGQATNTLSVFGLEISVLAARVFSLIGLAGSLVCMAAIGWYFLQGVRLGPDAIIRLKYGGLILDARGLNFQQNLPIVDVASIDDLARLAERQNTLITHVEVNFIHVYIVQCNGALYRHYFSAGQGEVAYLNPPSPQLPGYGNAYNETIDAAPLDGSYYEDYGQNNSAPVNRADAYPRRR